MNGYTEHIEKTRKDSLINHFIPDTFRSGTKCKKIDQIEQIQQAKY